MTFRKPSILIAVVAVAGLGSATYLRFTASGGELDSAAFLNPPDAEHLPVKTITATPVDSYLRERRYTGLLKASRRSQLSFQRGGQVVELLVDQGDVVTVGQILGRMDSRHIQAHREQLKAQIAEATAVLAELDAGPRQETIDSKRAELKAQQARAESLDRQVARRGSLVSTNAVTREEYESFSFDRDAARAQVDQLQSELEELLAGTRAEQIDAQRARLGQLQAALVDADHDLEDTVLRAPYTGRIAERLIDEGTVVNTGAAVFELLDDTNMEAWIGLPAAASRQLSAGGQCSVEVSGQQVRAIVQSLAADVDQATRTRMVRLRLDPVREQVLLPGQVVRLSLNERVQQSGYWVPTTSLTRGTRGLWSVYIIEKDSSVEEVTRRDVELLDTLGDRSFIRGALTAGDQIVASGTHRLVVGQQVEIETPIAVRVRR